LLGGQALILARTAGVRAARHAHEILDGYAEKYAGPVELDSRIDLQEGACVFQAHVSTSDGEFFGAASVFAVATAAAALRDAVSSRDPKSTIEHVTLREEAWSVGNAAFGDEATTVAANPRYLAARPGMGMPAPEPSGPLAQPPPIAPAAIPRRQEAPPATGFPGWIVAVMAIATLLSLAAAAAALLRR